MIDRHRPRLFTGKQPPGNSLAGIARGRALSLFRQDMVHPTSQILRAFDKFYAGFAVRRARQHMRNDRVLMVGGAIARQRGCRGNETIPRGVRPACQGHARLHRQRRVFLGQVYLAQDEIAALEAETGRHIEIGQQEAVAECVAAIFGVEERGIGEQVRCGRSLPVCAIDRHQRLIEIHETDLVGG